MSDWNLPGMPPSPPPFAAEALPPQPLRHSGLGIASFVISLLAGLIIFFTVIVAAVVVRQQGGQGDPQSPALIVVGLVTFLFLFLALVGLVLGITGAVQAQRKKLFAWLGICLNAFVLLGTIGLMALGYANQ